MTGPGSLTAAELFLRLSGPDPPRVLDVRNAEEFERWRVAGPTPVDILHLPYFAFLEDEAGACQRIAEWAGASPRRDLVVVCAEGGSSRWVTEQLAARGIPAANLDGGMVAWGLGTVWHAVPSPSPVRIWQCLRFGRGCLSYVLASGSHALLVDPHRAVDAYRLWLDQQGLELRGVIDTHLHADHVSGGPALARATGTPYLASPVDFVGSSLGVEPLADGRRVRLGTLEVLPITALATPGHTPGSTSLLVADACLVTGDTLFVDDVGRPDLGGHAAEWARDLHHSLHRRLAHLDDRLGVLPAHAAGVHQLDRSGLVRGTLGTLRRSNPAMRLDETAFVEAARIAAGTAPAEYARIRIINLGHPGQPEPEEHELTELELGENRCALSRR